MFNVYRLILDMYMYRCRDHRPNYFCRRSLYHGARPYRIANVSGDPPDTAMNRKYESFAASKIFIPLAFETYGPICSRNHIPRGIG